MSILRTTWKNQGWRTRQRNRILNYFLAHVITTLKATLWHFRSNSPGSLNAGQRLAHGDPMSRTLKNRRWRTCTRVTDRCHANAIWIKLSWLRSYICFSFHESHDRDIQRKRSTFKNNTKIIFVSSQIHFNISPYHVERSPWDTQAKTNPIFQTDWWDINTSSSAAKTAIICSGYRRREEGMRRGGRREYSNMQTELCITHNSM